MVQRLPRLALAVLLGWAALFSTAFWLVRPLLTWAAPAIGPSWLPTASLTFECAALAVAGWVAGRLHRANTAITALVFAATLSTWDFSESLGIDVPWLVRLTADALRDSRYLESWVASAATHVILFGSLIAGAQLSRPHPVVTPAGRSLPSPPHP